MRLVLILALALTLLAPLAHAQTPNAIRFRWAFGALEGPRDNPRLISIRQDTPLRSGDRIKFMVELDQPSFVYLLHHDPRNEISLLFPADLRQTVRTGQRQYVPAGDEWLEFDQTTGRETFYLLASVQRLTSIESIINRYNNAAPGGRTAISAEIVAEIRRLRDQNRNFSAQAERPVSIGGNVRGIDEAPARRLPDVATIAVEIAAGQFYARTFTIEHR